MRAAAPPPTALNSDTSCGIAVIFTVRAVYSPRPPPAATPTRMMTHGVAWKPEPLVWRTRIRMAVATIAIVIPPADTRLPLRAVAGGFIPPRPTTKPAAPQNHGGPAAVSTV